MKEYNTKLSFKQVAAYFIPAIALFSLWISANGAIAVGDTYLSICSAISIVFNTFVIGKYVIDTAKEDKSKSE